MKRLFALLLVCAAAFGQTLPKAILDSIASFKPKDAVVVVKPDNTDAVYVKLTPEAIFQRVEPGDRVLVSFKTGTTEAMRILIVSATDISKRNEADRADWTKRGISGVVAAKQGNTVTLRKRGMTGERVSAFLPYHRKHGEKVMSQDRHIETLRAEWNASASRSPLEAVA